MPNLWIISPSYRDVPSFLILQERVREVVRNHPELRALSPAFLLIDDTAGMDADMSKVRELPDVTVIEPPFNVGHQRALVLAVRLLSRHLNDDDTVVTLDADGQDRPEDLPNLLRPVLASEPREATVALARRTTRHEPPTFRAGYLIFRGVFRTLTGTVIRTGNFAAYRGVVAKSLLRHPYFDLCYSSTFIALKAPVVFVPCPRGPRYDGESRMSLMSLVLHGLRMLMPFLDRIAVRALALFSAAFAVSITLIGSILGIKTFSDRAIPGWATTTVLLAFTVSLIALSSFLIVFSTFSQSRGVSLSSLEDDSGTSLKPPSGTE